MSKSLVSRANGKLRTKQVAAMATVGCVPDTLVDDRLRDSLEYPPSLDAILRSVERLAAATDGYLAHRLTAGPSLRRDLVPDVLTPHRERSLRGQAIVVFERLPNLVPDVAEEALQELY